MADMVEKLKEIGFNSYEAKVYIALLKKHPATGYEVAKHANIPRPYIPKADILHLQPPSLQ